MQLTWNLSKTPFKVSNKINLQLYRALFRKILKIKLTPPVPHLPSPLLSDSLWENVSKTIKNSCLLKVIEKIPFVQQTWEVCGFLSMILFMLVWLLRQFSLARMASRSVREIRIKTSFLKLLLRMSNVPLWTLGC